MSSGVSGLASSSRNAHSTPSILSAERSYGANTNEPSGRRTSRVTPIRNGACWSVRTPYDRFSQTSGGGSEMTDRVIVGELPVGGTEPLISSAVRWGDLLFLSGRAPIDTTTM